MKKVSTEELKHKIASEHGIKTTKRVVQSSSSFKNNKISCKSNSVIVDKNGEEHPYMLNEMQRNDSKLKDFDYIYTDVPKDIKQVAKEANVSLNEKSTKVDAGNGCFSHGKQYSYKDNYCDE